MESIVIAGGVNHLRVYRDAVYDGSNHRAFRSGTAIKGCGAVEHVGRNWLGSAGGVDSACHGKHEKE